MSSTTAFINKVKILYSVLSCALLMVCCSLDAAELTADKKLSAAESVMPMLFGLVGILLLIFTLAALIKRFSGFNLTANHIKIIESQSLGAKEKLLIVEVQNKQYLLAATPHSINRIDLLEEPVVKKSANMSFEAMMKQFLQPKKKKAIKNENTCVAKSNNVISREEE